MIIYNLIYSVFIQWQWEAEKWYKARVIDSLYDFPFILKHGIIITLLEENYKKLFVLHNSRIQKLQFWCECPEVNPAHLNIPLQFVVKYKLVYSEGPLELLIQRRLNSEAMNLERAIGSIAARPTWSAAISVPCQAVSMGWRSNSSSVFTPADTPTARVILGDFAWEHFSW